ncbi:DMT family transporter [Planosporangium thailandense]|uniref:DMT family transporter n=1 Tax=Planosporangium thailandense TaxID=765197 RepID=A0ABX0Y184_9ACTN|nr:DMT family transporter [Planosporangium thailandense]NJC71195.1 DMT family transporter [Planosporangium thailandense]
MNLVALLAALGSAASFAVASALEQRAAKQQKQAKPLDPRLLLRLVREPMWLAAWIPEAIGTGLQAVALNFGPLALVEPLLVSGLFLAIPLEATLNRRPVHTRDFGVVALGGAGLAAFLVAARPQPGLDEPSVAGWLGVALWAGPVLAVCLAVGWQTRNSTRGAVLGIATGLLYGIGASLLKTLTSELAHEPLSVLAQGQFYGLVAVGFSAILLNQNAFQSGRLAVPLTAITIMDPVTGVVVGVTAFHETLSTDPVRLAVQSAAAVAMAGGIWLASTSRPDGNRQQAADSARTATTPFRPGGEHAS